MSNLLYTKPQPTKYSTVWDLGVNNKNNTIVHYGSYEGAVLALEEKLKVERKKAQA